MEPRTKQNPLRCFACGRSEFEVAFMVANSREGVCGDCIAQMVVMLSAEVTKLHAKVRIGTLSGAKGSE